MTLITGDIHDTFELYLLTPKCLNGQKWPLSYL